MKRQVFTVKDQALDIFLAPFMAHTIAHAVRLFQDASNQPDTEMYKHPEDFTLYHIAEWDDHTGKYENLPPEMVARAKDYQERANLKAIA